MKKKLNTKKSDMNAVAWLQDGLDNVYSHYSTVITVCDAIACQVAHKKNEWEIYFKSNSCRECEIAVIVKNEKNPRIEIANAICNRNKRVAAEKAYADTPTARAMLYSVIFDEQQKYLQKHFDTIKGNYGWVAGGTDDTVVVATKSYDKHADKNIVLETTGVVGDTAQMLKHKVIYT
jgi:hypothetical protein